MLVLRPRSILFLFDVWKRWLVSTSLSGCLLLHPWKRKNIIWAVMKSIRCDDHNSRRVLPWLGSDNIWAWLVSLLLPFVSRELAGLVEGAENPQLGTLLEHLIIVGR